MAKNSDFTDSEINSNRNVGARYTVLGLYAAASTGAIAYGTYWFADFASSGDSFVTGLSFALGIGASLASLLFTIPQWFMIKNNPNEMSVTQDLVRSFFGKNKVHVSYGAGLHAKFPWEKPTFCLSLEDIPVPFEFETTVRNAVLKGEGSFRYRPDASQPITYLQSAASVGTEIRELVIAEIQNFFASDEAKLISSTETAPLIKALNAHLKRELGPNKKADFEDNNGVSISDATVGKISLSEEYQRTKTAIAEAEAFQTGVQTLLGMNQAEINQALKDGSLTATDVAEARRVFMFISGNTEGFERKELVVRLEGLSPEVASAIGNALNNPAVKAGVIAAASSNAGRNKSKGK